MGYEHKELIANVLQIKIMFDNEPVDTCQPLVSAVHLAFFLAQSSPGYHPSWSLGVADSDFMTC